MNRSRLLATAAASIGLATGAFLPSVALAATPPPVGPLTATRVPLPPVEPPPGVIVKPPIVDPPVIDPGDVVWPTPTPTHSPKPPKPPVHDVPTVPPVVVNPESDPDPEPEPSESPSPSPSQPPAGDTDGGGSGTQDDPEYPGTGLPVTGASVGILAGAGLLLAGGGALLVGLARRRRVDVDK